MQIITILIVDDHKLIRDAWQYILQAHPSFEIIGGCSTAEEAMAVASAEQPNVIILDINLPGISGIEATSMLRKISPLSKILGISMYVQPSYARKMIKNGALGYVTKSSPRDEMIQAIKEVHAGRKYVCSETRNILADQMLINRGEKEPSELSHREIEIIELIKKGFSSKQIAEAIFLSVKTVEVHRYNILKKLNLKNSAALINYINTAYEGKD